MTRSVFILLSSSDPSGLRLINECPDLHTVSVTGVRGSPAVLDDGTAEILSRYEVSLTEPLHDIKNVAGVIFSDAHKLIDEKNLSGQLLDFISALTGESIEVAERTRQPRSEHRTVSTSQVLMWSDLSFQARKLKFAAATLANTSSISHSIWSNLSLCGASQPAD